MPQRQDDPWTICCHRHRTRCCGPNTCMCDLLSFVPVESWGIARWPSRFRCLPSHSGRRYVLGPMALSIFAREVNIYGCPICMLARFFLAWEGCICSIWCPIHHPILSFTLFHCIYIMSLRYVYR
ncbi:hypothetical protein M433DRAFT_387390 [Acidomyces richmondensis BFW]|nr:MAG: hypothetical protein FE78DRAFT_233913 [Acidomyces sp. 'richmondensis']KYG42848.1 hypothetical protein M433DRAFT_387390 [Acidomyces richmondensis BFW]